MSYDLYLIDPITREILEVDKKHHMKGGTYQVGGTNRLQMNVTYNYSPHLEKAFNDDEGIRSIYGMSGVESIPFIKAAMRKLKDDVSDNYWDSTEGNTKRALLNILTLAEMRPDGEWCGD